MDFLFKKIVISFYFIFCSFYTKAQPFYHSSVFETTGQKKYLRFYYDNDFFTKTDYYYTQGIVLEYGDPALKNFFLSKLLLTRAEDDTRYSAGLKLSSYTPTSISSDSILYGDRPFAGFISFSSSASVTNQERKQWISSSITIGIIGPAAQGKEIQTGIHHWLKNILPHGWQYQVKNDVIINYDIGLEKRLWDAGSHFLLNTTTTASLGTFSDKLSSGINFMAGKYNDPYKLKLKTGNSWQYYLYGQARANFIGYDATMQGGLFNHTSPYTISSGDVKRATFQADAGIIGNFRKIRLSYSQSFLTKEFTTGRYHRWGGICIGVAF